MNWVFENQFKCSFVTLFTHGKKLLEKSLQSYPFNSRQIERKILPELSWGSLLFTAKCTETPGTHFTNLRRMFQILCFVWDSVLIVILFLILMNNRIQLLGLWFGHHYHHIHRLANFLNRVMNWSMLSNDSRLAWFSLNLS